MQPLPRISIVGAKRVPPSVTWIARRTPMDYTFYALPRSLLDALAEAACDEDRINDATDYLIFGDCNYADGGGAHPWLAIRQCDGRVFSVDLERDDPVHLLNSSISAFVDTFLVFDGFLRDCNPSPEDLEDLLRAIDPLAFGHSEWRDLAKYVRAVT